MSETNTTFPRPSEIFLDMIIAFLAPMFLSATGGDIVCARMAAIETLNAYRAESQADLIAIAQIVAFGLAALSSLSLSMAGDLPLPMVLRLRISASACNRAAEQNRRTRKPAPQINPFEAFTEDRDDSLDEAAVLAALADTQKRAAAADAAARASIAAARASAAAEPAPTPPTPTPPAPTPPAPVPPAPAAPNPGTTDPAAQNPTAAIPQQDYNAMWAAATARVAGELTADLRRLSKTERRTAIINASALTDCANDLLAGGTAPRPSPGDLAAFIRRNTV